ncbi:MAG TPA: hypothetical protein PK867_11805, partial [Pirellulales bacterium]|nr:hypothetical protein [Pirellulales bacterium]
MNPKYEKLKSLLKELLQLDQPDLDFGLYRIMHAKSAEVTQFLEHDLLPQVRAELAGHESAEVAEAKQALAERIELRRKLGDDPDKDEVVAALSKKVAEAGVPSEQLEAEVYDHLFGFFRRYYSEGDFLSKRVYKPGVYAIPYEGEEVKLHWANADQYYIKTSEYLRDYAFRLRPDDEANPLRVHFQLVDAAEGEHGNVKPAQGKDRVFILAAHDFMAEQDGQQGKELAIRFEYRPATLADWPDDVREGKTKPPAQKELSEIAERRILSVGNGLRAVPPSVGNGLRAVPPSVGNGLPAVPPSVGSGLRAVPETGDGLPSPSSSELDGLGRPSSWLTELANPHTKSDGERADYSRLRAHLNRYVARNTFDYFIHKDLGTFLRRELDFYIKNEVMHLDDVENETVPRVEQYLSKIKVIRRIAGKIIDFLAQLEDFQKKLWLKKKFVVETHYCISIGIIPDDFLPE